MRSDRQRRSVAGASDGRLPAAVGAARENAPVPLNRIAWIVTVVACLLAAVLLLVSGYQGYAAVFTAVGASAAINLL